jgi:predicted PurR-regulated permease PerM
MNYLYIIPIVLAVLFSILVWALKNNYHKENLKRTLQIIGILCGCIAIIAILLLYYYSGDKTQLFKLSIPALILVTLVVQIKQKENSDTK